MIREYVAEGKLNAVSGEHTMEKRQIQNDRRRKKTQFIL